MNNLKKYAVGAVLILLVPLVAMQFSDEVDWNLADFIIIGILLMGSGFTYELAVRNVKNSKQRLIIGAVVLGLMLLLWAEMAVGTFGSPIAGS